VKAKGRLKNVTNIVYWYGASKDPPNAYSLIPTTKLIPFDEACKKGHNTIPKAIQKALDAGKTLNASQQMFVEGLEEMMQDKEKQPEERRGYMVKHIEEFELPPEEIPAEVDEAKPKTKKRKSLNSKVEPAKKKAKKPTKVKKAKAQADQGDEPPADDTAPEPVKKKKGTLKKNKVENQMTTEEAGTSGALLVTPNPKDMAQAVDYDTIGDNDVSSHEDKDDEDLEEPPSESDEDDEDYGADPVPKKKKKKTQRKEAPKKKTIKVKTKIEKTKEKRAPSQQALKRKEQRTFEQCEHKYLPLIARWKDALGKSDDTCLNKVYGELKDVCEDFSAPFIEAYDVAPLLKKSKQQLDNETRREVFQLFKAVYKQKKALVPPSFKPALRPVAKEPIEEDKPKEKIEVEKPPPPAEEEKSTPTPSKRVDSLENTPATEPVKTQAKPEKKKKFSLGTLMRPKPILSKSNSKSDLSRKLSSNSLDRQRPATKMPTWISKPVSEELTNDDRCFALEFLQQAAPFVPKGDHVNHDAIARALEAAIFQWAGGDKLGLWTNKYWDKVHELVACISGKETVGTIAKMIGEGKFQTAEEIVRLSDDSLMASFDGKTIIL